MNGLGLSRRRCCGEGALSGTLRARPWVAPAEDIPVFRRPGQRPLPAAPTRDCRAVHELRWLRMVAVARLCASLVALIGNAFVRRSRWPTVARFVASFVAGGASALRQATSRDDDPRGRTGT